MIEDGPTRDVDADLRVALLALFVGGERRIAAEFLRASAEKKQAAYTGSRQLEGQPDQPPLASWYQRLRSDSVKSVIRAEAAATLTMAKRLPAKRNRGRRSE